MLRLTGRETGWSRLVFPHGLPHVVRGGHRGTLGAGLWLLGEGLGGIFIGSATDPLLVLLAVALHQVAPRAVMSRVGVPTGPAEVVVARARATS